MAVNGKGLIPACAGKTSRVQRIDAAFRAHPRMRGENFECRPGPARVTGSSPHARGKRSEAPVDRINRRLIPACAGKTTACSVDLDAPGAHPRMRGENCRLPNEGDGMSGSSPHARGKLILIPGISEGIRLIPACAGKTNVSRSFSTSFGAHPRMRGENRIVTCSNTRPLGSSPHARGKRGLFDYQASRYRLIPACAGKTLAGTLSSAMNLAHPRMRGENICVPDRPHGASGSSPHARGKRDKRTIKNRQGRLIPACAGKTEFTFDCPTLPTAHPRMRGENAR